MFPGTEGCSVFEVCEMNVLPNVTPALIIATKRYSSECNDDGLVYQAHPVMTTCIPDVLQIQALVARMAVATCPGIKVSNHVSTLQLSLYGKIEPGKV